MRVDTTPDFARSNLDRLHYMVLRLWITLQAHYYYRVVCKRVPDVYWIPEGLIIRTGPVRVARARWS